MSSDFLNFSVHAALVILSVSFLVSVFKVVHGPTLPDRILALDMLVSVAIGFIAVLGIKTGYTLYLDVAIALGLVGFLATVAFARFILARGRVEESEETEMQPLVTAEAGAVPAAEQVTAVDIEPPFTKPAGRGPRRGGKKGN